VISLGRSKNQKKKRQKILCESEHAAMFFKIDVIVALKRVIRAAFVFKRVEEKTTPAVVKGRYKSPEAAKIHSKRSKGELITHSSP